MNARQLAALGGALALLWAVPVAGCAAGDDGTTTVQRAQMMLQYSNPAVQTPEFKLELGPKTVYPEIQETSFEKRVLVEYLLEYKLPPGPCPPPILTPSVVLDIEGPGLIDKGGLPMIVQVEDLAQLAFEPTVAFDCAGGPCLAALVAKVLWADGAAEHPIFVEVEVR